MLFGYRIRLSREACPRDNGERESRNRGITGVLALVTATLTLPRQGLRGVGIRYFICDAVVLQYISIFTVIPNEVRNLASLTASELGV